MMGFAIVTADAPVTKTSSSILAFKEDIVAKSPETACINCGRCVEVCPSRIIPSRLADLAKRHDEEGFVAMNGLECVECGSCSYVCPGETAAQAGDRLHAQDSACEQEEKVREVRRN